MKSKLIISEKILVITLDALTATWVLTKLGKYKSKYIKAAVQLLVDNSEITGGNREIELDEKEN